ncbi:hypothetical protein TNCV_4877671 [Trichonephila clavipes]|nr:hypothetical protein TNCV_4877671 [Trichonephila clavipes]
MHEGKCTKRYPRVLLKDTQTNNKAYPLYRRRAPEDGSRTKTKKNPSPEKHYCASARGAVPFVASGIRLSASMVRKRFNNVDLCTSGNPAKRVHIWPNTRWWYSIMVWTMFPWSTLGTTISVDDVYEFSEHHYRPGVPRYCNIAPGSL